MTEQAYPLDWPKWQERTPVNTRLRARFSAHDYNGYSRHLSMADVLNRLLPELDALGARTVVVSTNVELRRDGLPYSNRKAPDDSGAAVYFRIKDDPYCLACDRWDRVEDNLAAIAAHIKAMRGQERWGVGTQQQAFAGYKALPAPGEENWWTVLGLSERPESMWMAMEAYKRKARIHHPDTGPSGSHDMMSRLNAAKAEAERELR